MHLSTVLDRLDFRPGNIDIFKEEFRSQSAGRWENWAKTQGQTKTPTKAIKLEPGKWFHSLAVWLEHNDLERSDWRNAISFQPQFCHPEPASRGWHVTGHSPMRARLGDALHARKPEILGRNRVWTIRENGQCPLHGLVQDWALHPDCLLSSSSLCPLLFFLLLLLLPLPSLAPDP